MKNTIKADKERIMVKEEFINDNTLLQATLEENREVTVTVRFVKSEVAGIQEQFLTRMKIYDALSDTDFEKLVRVSEDHSAIAIFKKIKDYYLLDRLYDAVEHEFALDEFIDIVYKEKFPELTLDKHLILKCTN